jgi:hypothetical protein
MDDDGALLGGFRATAGDAVGVFDVDEGFWELVTLVPDVVAVDDEVVLLGAEIEKMSLVKKTCHHILIAST